MGDRLRIMTALAEPLRQPAQQRRRILGDRFPRPGRLQPFRFQKRPTQQIQLRGIGQIVQRQPMSDINRIREIRVNLNRLHIGNDQQLRIFQRQRVLLQLPPRRVQVFMLALVFPGETTPSPDIRPAIAPAGLFHALFEGEPFAVRIDLAGTGFPATDRVD